MLSYYEILQIDENASAPEIKSAYRKLCKILHPDLHNNTREANVIFNLLHDAYETLSDPIKKRNYNPRTTQSDSYDISTDKYDEIITGYEKIVKDYKKIIKSKNQREKDLLEEIRKLQAGGRPKESEKNNDAENHEIKEESEDIKQTLVQESAYTTWGIVLLTILGILAVGVFILIALIPSGWWFLIGIVVIPIWLLISAFR